ncbi:MAG: hypothetical protein HPY66_2371 [Firmicutes bacterium]|nr:hypothetical protein [Bacillota bacterium]
MHRREETVGLYRGDLYLDHGPSGLAVIVITGSLTIADNTQVSCDIWCLGDVIAGSKCNLRSITADGYIKVGEKTVVNRWLDAGTSLYLGPAVSIIASASASEKIIIGPGFKGGKVYAPTIQALFDINILSEALQEAASASQYNLREDIANKISYWTSIRDSSETKTYPIDENDKVRWIKEKSVNSLGDYSVGPNSVVLHDIISSGSVDIGNNCIIVGSIHTDKDLYLGRKSLVTGNVACGNLYVENEVIIAGALHAAGDAVINADTVIGLRQNEGGLAVTGSVQLKDRVTVSQEIFAGDTIYTV